jgi:hypothetical protein
MSLPARLCCSTSENSVKAKLAEFTSLLKNSSTPLPSTLLLLLSDFSRLTLGLDQGSTLIYASFVKGPHERSAT